MTGPLFPANLSRVWVRGTFIDLNGDPKTGQVSLQPSPTVLLNRGPKLIISGRVFTAALNPATGSFAVQVPATDDPDVTPIDWTYKVTEPTGRSYNIVVPIGTPPLNAPGDPLHGEPVIDLIDIVPAPGAQPGTVQLVAGRGITSTAIDEFGHLIVTYTDGTTQDVGSVGSGGGGGSPSGGAGGVLSGTYPNPGFAVDMATQAELTAHVNSPTPHPTYDDLPSLSLLFMNGLV